MAVSEVSIANRALQKLGARRIESFDDDSPNARSVSTAYDGVRDELLRDYSWNFAVKRASIPANAVQTVYGGLNRFGKPADFIRLLRGTEAGTFFREEHKRWQIEGDYIVTSEAAPLEFRYVARIEDPTKFDPLFTQLFVLTLAVDMIGDIEVSDSRKRTLLEQLVFVRARARSVNTLENAPQEDPQDSWLDARL